MLKRSLRSSVATSASLLTSLPLLSAFAGAGWHFSSVLLRPDRTAYYPEQLVAVRGRLAWFARTRWTAQAGDWALSWAGGRGVVGPPVTSPSAADLAASQFAAPDLVCRTWLGGTPPPDGTPVAFDASLYDPDPAVHGLAFSTVSVPTPLGECPAWFVPGAADEPGGDTWVVAVHGRGADRRECLRVLPTLHRLGLSVLAISYRNDLDAPASPDGYYHLGDTEWRDVEAAVSYALTAGASRVVLLGWSMGAAITGAFLDRSELARSVTAVVWDCPLLDWRATLRAQAALRRLPAALISVVVPMTRQRIGVDFDRFDLTRRPPAVRPPTLIFHGTMDSSVPVAPARGLAADAAGLGWPLRYEEVPGAEHTATWNADPRRYERALTEFLDAHTPPVLRPCPPSGTMEA